MYHRELKKSTMDIVIKKEVDGLEFLNINDTKLKVTLTNEDCDRYGIDHNKSDFSRGEIRRTVKEILVLAERECGFYAEGERILVHMYPLPDGRFEMLISRLSIASPRDRRIISSSEGISLFEEKRSTYRFSSSEVLKRAVAAVYKKGVSADLYRSEDGSYYLHIMEDTIDGIAEFETLVEYAERLLSLPIFILFEYGELIAKGNAFDYIISPEFV